MEEEKSDLTCMTTVFIEGFYDEDGTGRGLSFGYLLQCLFSIVRTSIRNKVHTLQNSL